MDLFKSENAKNEYREYYKSNKRFFEDELSYRKVDEIYKTKDKTTEQEDLSYGIKEYNLGYTKKLSAISSSNAKKKQSKLIAAILASATTLVTVLAVVISSVIISLSSVTITESSIDLSFDITNDEEKVLVATLGLNDEVYQEILLDDTNSCSFTNLSANTQYEIKVKDKATNEVYYSKLFKTKEAEVILEPISIIELVDNSIDEIDGNLSFNIKLNRIPDKKESVKLILSYYDNTVLLEESLFDLEANYENILVDWERGLHLNVKVNDDEIYNYDFGNAEPETPLSIAFSKINKSYSHKVIYTIDVSRENLNLMVTVTDSKGNIIGSKPYEYIEGTIDGLLPNTTYTISVSDENENVLASTSFKSAALFTIKKSDIAVALVYEVIQGKTLKETEGCYCEFFDKEGNQYFIADFTKDKNGNTIVNYKTDSPTSGTLYVKCYLYPGVNKGKTYDFTIKVK